MDFDHRQLTAKLKEWWASAYAPPAAALAISLLLFLALVADLRSRGWFFQLDGRMYRWTAAMVSPTATDIMAALSFLGSRPAILAVVAIVAAFLYYGKRWGELISLALAYGGGELCSICLKHLFQRTRPPSSLLGPGGYSFPSGHAFAVTLIYGFLAYLALRAAPDRRLQWPIFAWLGLLGLGVGFSRLYLQAHWLTDVLGGYLAGFAWLMVSLLAGPVLEAQAAPWLKRPETAEPPPENPDQ